MKHVADEQKTETHLVEIPFTEIVARAAKDLGITIPNNADIRIGYEEMGHPGFGVPVDPEPDRLEIRWTVKTVAPIKK